MSDLPVVLICIRGSEVSYANDGDVDIVVLDWDRLESGTLGDLCRAYKEVWDLHPDMRRDPLTDIIALVGSRFPIMAEFRPQRFRDADHIEPDGAPVAFNATEAVLIRGPDYIDNLQDAHYPTDELANTLPERQAHDGPFEVEVDRRAAMEFFYADENEAADGHLSGE